MTWLAQGDSRPFLPAPLECCLIIGLFLSFVHLAEIVVAGQIVVCFHHSFGSGAPEKLPLYEVRVVPDFVR